MSELPVEATQQKPLCDLDFIVKQQESGAVTASEQLIRSVSVHILYDCLV